MTSALILASRSPYRADLLRRITGDFDIAPADVDEHVHPGEAISAYVQRLSRDKARAVADRHTGTDTLIIGSDQAAERDGQILGKPGDQQTAVRMLTDSAGREVRFHTGLCVIHAGSGNREEHMDITRVHFRDFDEAEARHYLEREPALDCAGSFRCEGLGITLFERVESEDPTALIGLPLIAVCRALRALGYDPLAAGLTAD